jgi:GNAT superfamily N-acetyltransferase
MDVALREATEADAEAVLALTREGFETYRSFAPAGWEPPPETARDLADRLAAPGAWGVVAVQAGALAGFGAFEPARENARDGELVPGLAHVWAVFVAPAHWGSGLATAILMALTDHIADAGVTQARLLTPAGQGRARAFYAREGWREITGPFPVAELGLDLVELRRSI